MPRLAAEGGLDRDLGLTLEVGAPHDDRAGIALYRRHIYEGKGAAISAGVLASAAHAAFGLVGHGVPWRPQMQAGPSSAS